MDITVHHFISFHRIVSIFADLFQEKQTIFWTSPKQISSGTKFLPFEQCLISSSFRCRPLIIVREWSSTQFLTSWTIFCIDYYNTDWSLIIDFHSAFSSDFVGTTKRWLNTWPIPFHSPFDHKHYVDEIVSLSSKMLGEIKEGWWSFLVIKQMQHIHPV